MADRHGSWEISFCKHSAAEGGVNRFASLAVTDLGSSCEVEVRAGADDGSRFVRGLVGQIDTGVEPLDSPILATRISAMLERAIQLSNRLGPSDLVEAYLPGRKATSPV